MQDRVQHLLHILTHFDIIVLLNTDSPTTGNPFINPVIIHKKGESLIIVLDALQLKTMIDETKCSWPIEPIQIILTRIKGPIFLSIADMNSAYNQMPLDKPSQRFTNFVIAGQQYCFKRLCCGITIGPAAFLFIVSSVFKPLIKNKIITYLDDVTKSSKMRTSKPLPTNLSFFGLQVRKFFGHQVRSNHIQPLKSKIDGFLKLQPHKNKKEAQNFVGFLTFISKYICNLQVILELF